MNAVIDENGTAYPRSAEDLTADWFAAALRAPVTDVRTEPIHLGSGFIGEVVRAHLAYDDADGPATVIVKIPSAREDARQIAHLFGFYRREVGYYRHLAAGSAISVPQPIVARYDPETGDAVLILADAAGRPGDQVGGWTLGQAKLAIGAIARCHAANWGRDFAGHADWLPAWDDPALVAIVEQAYGGSLETFFGRHGETLSDSFRAFATALGPHISALAGALARPPATLVHGDYRLDNLIFGGESGVVAVDWQIVARGGGAFDVAYLLGQSGTPDMRRAHEAELLEGYLGALEAGGVVGYGAGELRRDYRRATAYSAIYAVIAAGSLIPRTDYEGEVLDLIVGRTAAAIDDLGLVAGELEKLTS